MEPVGGLREKDPLPGCVFIAGRILPAEEHVVIVPVHHGRMVVRADGWRGLVHCGKVDTESHVEATQGLSDGRRCFD